MTGTRLRAAAASALLLVALAASRAAAETVAAPFGTSKAVAAIMNVDGEADVDDYAAPLLKGELLSVTVKPSKKAALVPAVHLFDPDGADRTPALTLGKDGRTLTFSEFAADVTGCWRVSVSGADGTEGAYTAAFRIQAATKFGVKSATLGDG